MRGEGAPDPVRREDLLDAAWRARCTAISARMRNRSSRAFAAADRQRLHATLAAIRAPRHQHATGPRLVPAVALEPVLDVRMRAGRELVVAVAAAPWGPTRVDVVRAALADADLCARDPDGRLLIAAVGPHGAGGRIADAVGALFRRYGPNLTVSCTTRRADDTAASLLHRLRRGLEPAGHAP